MKKKKEFRPDYGLGSPTERLSWWFLLRLMWEQFGIWGYSPANGLLAVREAVAAEKLRRNDVALDAEKNISFSPKGSRIIYPFLIQLLIKMLNRTEFVMMLPFYPGHLKSVLWAGGKPVFVAAWTAREYVDRLEEELRKGRFWPAAVIICSIGNPFGYKTDLESFRRLVRLAHEFGFILIVDEAYAELSYDGIAAPSPFQAEDALPVTVATMTGSKFLSAAAGGIGLAMGPENIIAPLNDAMEFLSEGGNGLIQTAFGFALPHVGPYVRELLGVYSGRAEGYTGLLENAGLPNAKNGVGDGGMFLFPPTDDVDADELVTQVASEGVTIRPGRMFLNTGDALVIGDHPGMNFLRLCLREDMRTTERAFSILGSIIARMRAAREVSLV